MSELSINPEQTKNGVGAGPWILLALVIPIYFLTMFYRMAPSILAPSLAQDFDVSVAQLATLSGATFITYGLMQLPSGLLADLIGGRRTVCMITVIVGIGNLAFAFAPTLESARLARFLIGIGSAVCVPCAAMLACRFPPAMFSRVNGIFLATGTAGTVLAGTPLAVASAAFGWRAVMATCGVMSIVFAALVWVLLKEPQKTTTGLSFRDSLTQMFQGLLLVLRSGKFWPLCMWYCLMVGLYFSVGGLWWGPYLMDGCNMTAAQAGMIISIAYLVSIIGQPLLAVLSERFRTRKKILVGCTLVALAVTAVLPFWGAHMSPVALTLQGIIFTISCGMVGAVAFASAREMFPLRVAGTAIGCLQTLPYLLMTPLIQKGFGMVLELRTIASGGDQSLAYAQAMYVNIGIITLALVAILLTKETFRQDSEA